MDNVLNFVVERHLLGSDGAVKYFGLEYISRLDDEELANIAYETEGYVSDRREAHRKMQILEEAMNIVRGL
jgi:predicted nucleotidyltransferase